MTAATRSPRFIRHRRRSDRSLQRPHFFQQPARGGFALRRDPLLPPSAKVGKNAVQTCGLKIRSRPAHGILLFCISRAVTLMQTSLNVELLLRLSPLPLRMQNVEVCSSTFQSKSGSAQRNTSIPHFRRIGTHWPAAKGNPKTMGFWRRSFPHFFRCWKKWGRRRHKREKLAGRCGQK